MVDTGFHVPAEKLDRLPPYHGSGLGSTRPLAAAADLPSGAGGLVSTLADWHRFGSMLLANGGGLAVAELGALMTTDHLTRQQRDASRLFLEGAGWGFGGAV